MTVYGGTQKITFGQGGDDSDMMAKRNAAMAHAAYLDMGINAVGAEGVGNTFMKPAQSPIYGNVNETEGDLSQGMNSNFGAPESTYNAPLENPDRQTGSMMYFTSNTNDPQTPPEQLDTSAVEARIRRMAANGSINLNPRSVFNI